jgi:hypothetical protein
MIIPGYPWTLDMPWVIPGSLGRIIAVAVDIPLLSLVVDLRERAVASHGKSESL